MTNNNAQIIKNFIGAWSRLDAQDLASFFCDVLFCERVDRTQFAEGGVDLPCLGVFEMSLGKIKEWRDYFDLDTFIRGRRELSYA